MDQGVHFKGVQKYCDSTTFHSSCKVTAICCFNYYNVYSIIRAQLCTWTSTAL
jgi:hypothetical protein